MESHDASSACGCCDGIQVETPERVANRPGLDTVDYRVGRHATFRESMLARLSAAALPALAPLRTRDPDDFTIALVDSAAAMLDVLTFYQERLANESWLRTAREPRSVRALARLIGYRPSPGVAASTHLAFTLQQAPGAPAQSAAPVTIPAGTRVQSVPGPDEEAQTFETIAPAEARAEWNAVPVQVSRRWMPARGDRDLYLAGTATRLEPGDALLIVGAERAEDPGDERWDVRVLTAVEADPGRDRTRVEWEAGLGDASTLPAARDVRVYALRRRAGLFGHNAPDARLMATAGGSQVAGMLNASGTDWKDFEIGDVIDLDASYPRVVAGSWVALVRNYGAPLPGTVELYRAVTVSHPSRADFALSAKVTRIVPDTDESLSLFKLRRTLVLAESEALPTAERPLGSPLFGGRVELAYVVDGLLPGQALAVAGKRQRLRVRTGAEGLQLALDDGAARPLRPGDSLPIAAAPVRLTGGTAALLEPDVLAGHLDAASASVQLRVRLVDTDGREGTLACLASQVRLAPAEKDDAEVSEVVLVDDAPDAISHDRDRTTARLASGLRHCYDRHTARVNANVAPATHGESVAETLGGGDAAARDQRFALRQAPLTYVRAPTPEGSTSTLQVRVNDLLWTEVPTLYGRGPDERVFTTAVDEEGRAVVRFGDGVEGARLPSGQDNLRAAYRRGTGAAGNLPAGRLTTPLTRPLGVVEVTNPAPATGGADIEAPDAIRAGAPLQVLALGRAVSVRDYRDFSRSFAGIAKAHAVWIPSGPGRGVFLTVAGAGGDPVDAAGATHRDLVAALRRFGDGLVPLRVVSYADARFRVRARVRVAADAEPERVLAAAGEALRAHFGFAAREFGQTVSVDEVAAVLHGVGSVVAVNVEKLYRTGTGVSLQPRLFARVPAASPHHAPLPAELLTLDDAGLDLGVMP
ncbi:MAG TPA: baseplate J/gp47 family protein [Longimicrobium sp.]|nr:baseplate J/gp47 family protein [Longimicrobium sp.]